MNFQVNDLPEKPDNDELHYFAEIDYLPNNLVKRQMKMRIYSILQKKEAKIAIQVFGKFRLGIYNIKLLVVQKW